MFWLLDVRTLTNLTNTLILSQKTKISVLEAELAGRAKLVVCGFGQCLTGQNRTKTGHDRAGQGMMRTDEAALLGLIPSDIFVHRTTVSAVLICPFSQRTFSWHIF